MSVQVKKAGRIGKKIVAVFLFLFLIMFNVEVGLYDGDTSESGLFGLTMIVVGPILFAEEHPDPRIGEGPFAMVCCGPQCSVFGIPMNYCIGEGDFICCF